MNPKKMKGTLKHWRGVPAIFGWKMAPFGVLAGNTR
jgi:hypothetical protein